ncbi:hypothetical protein MSAN_01202000 [Mycena sanguinolenta]|uniref:Uncharacterized protein n=1 Tax=Mycena sanguinolenta TaxID=230812 RepID=A0A8H7D4N0_9AGAR|nr:hypothetical protein MSAN_01202000 [Mycena sanguinolenta]
MLARRQVKYIFQKMSLEVDGQISIQLPFLISDPNHLFGSSLLSASAPSPQPTTSAPEMLDPGLSLLSLAVLQHLVYGIQVPFHIPATGISMGSAAARWKDLAARPDANTTSQLIFDAVNSLQQHWPHTRYRNGHSIVPGIVPVGTLLYHGRGDHELPNTPDWTSTDPEHAFPFAGDSATDGNNNTLTGCWLLTLVATRPLKVLYFDGSSAATILGGGTVDTQDLLIWGKVDPARWLDERARLDDLCAWGKEFRLDGFLRMEMDFEIMLYDFSRGVEVVSIDYLAALHTLHLSPPRLQPTALSSHSSPSADNLPGSNNSAAVAMLMFELIHAASWHNLYPGDTRVKLDLGGFVSFYDTSLAPSLVPIRQGKERWDHRAAGISAPDLETIRTCIRELWTGTRAALRLLNTTIPANVDERTSVIQAQLRIMLTPYILYTARPILDAASGADLGGAWALPVWKSCGTKHTAYIHASRALQARMTPSERLLLRALDDTNHEICRVVVKMWVAGVHAGLDPFIALNAASSEHVSRDPLVIVQGWRADTTALMSWLDWAVWVKCHPACGVEEMCYLPTWPFFYIGPDANRWERPQPRCIRRFDPYSQL